MPPAHSRPCARSCFGLALVAVVVLLLMVPGAAGAEATGTLSVRSVPGEASVTLDGVYRGLTPNGTEALVVEGVAPGPHQLVLSKRGFLDGVYPFWIRPGDRSEIRLTLTPATNDVGSVSIVSSPAGADVLLDNAYRGRTPITISGLAPGQYPVVLDLPGYVPYTTTLEVEEGAMTYLDPALTPSGAAGFVSVDSVPAGAVVYIDSVPRGATPLTVPATAGSHRIELDRQGYADWNSTVQVTAGATAAVNASLQPLPASSGGGIAISSEPTGAEVYMDDVYRGVTPASGNLELTGVPAGRHTLLIRREGYSDYTITVEVAPDVTIRVRPRLSASGAPTAPASPTVPADRGTIQANSTPSGASVSLDGLYKGTTPLTLTDVPSGLHSLRFTLEGYVEREQAVTVQAGQIAVVDANLTASGGRAGMPGVAALAAIGVMAVAGALVRRRGPGNRQ